MKEVEPFLSWRGRFTTYFSDWEALDRSTDFLLRGIRLREAQEFLASRYRSFFSERELLYVDRSHRFERKSKRRRNANIVIIVGLIVFSIVLILARLVRP